MALHPLSYVKKFRHSCLSFNSLKAGQAFSVDNEKTKNTTEVVVEALRPFGTTIFTEMTALANTHGAVNLSQGFPDFDGPEQIRVKAAEAIVRGPNQYAPSSGIPELNAYRNSQKPLLAFVGSARSGLTASAKNRDCFLACAAGVLEPLHLQEQRQCLPCVQPRPWPL